VLSRGYARSIAAAGVTVVSDGRQILADVRSAGDEPLMLSRALPGVPVLVCADRYLAGRLAEEKLGVTVHVLDDGFQHVALERDVDLLVTGEEDLEDCPMPSGRLREPLAAAVHADAAIVWSADVESALRIAARMGVGEAFRVTRTLGEPRHAATGEWIVVPRDAPVLAVAGIARPERFFADVASAGWRLVGTLAFRDHHVFTPRDVTSIAAAAQAAGASVVMTTEKDATRFEAAGTGQLPLVVLPMAVSIEPAAAFDTWLRGCIVRARSPLSSSPSTVLEDEAEKLDSMRPVPPAGADGRAQ
jgi:tetraacyldisaccharide 4'-kinase